MRINLTEPFYALSEIVPHSCLYFDVRPDSIHVKDLDSEFETEIGINSNLEASTMLDNFFWYSAAVFQAQAMGHRT
jgi:hypothetical protein